MIFTKDTASTNPRAGLIYQPWGKTTFKLLYGTAFRSPNVYEADYGTGSGGNSGFSLNPDVRPESMRSIEAVCEQQLGQHVRLSGTVFWNYLRDLISLQSIELGKEFLLGRDEPLRELPSVVFSHPILPF